jgi:hypothetical protein
VCCFGLWTLDDVDALHALWTAAKVCRYLWADTVIRRDSAEQVVESHFDDCGKVGFRVLGHSRIPPTSLTATPNSGFCGFRFLSTVPEIGN